MSGCLQLLDTGDEPCGVSIKTVSVNDTEILLYKDMSFKKLNCHIYTGILCLSTPLKNKLPSKISILWDLDRG